jgi:hypothetical protein
MPPPKAVGKSGKQQQQQQSLPPAQSKPVPVKRKRVEDVDIGSPAADRPTKKAKPSKPSTVHPVPPASGKHQAKAKAKAKAKVVLDSDVPALRTRSKVTHELPKGMQTRQTRK